jgi:copper chaperone NosL
MIISEVRFAAAYLTRQGEWRLFDDLGDMLEFSKTSREDISVFWVHDYESEAWLKAESAIFVESAELHTPMGYGIVALGHRERAERLAHQTSGEILSFAGLLAPP